MLDRFPQSALTAAAATQAVIVLGLYSAGPDPAAAVAFLLLMGGALKPVFITTPNAMLHCAPGRTKIVLAANSGSYNADMAAGAALGALIPPPADVRGSLRGADDVLVSVQVAAGGRRHQRATGPPGQPTSADVSRSTAITKEL
ncbi:hypothetical protein [Streptomyces lavendulae]|uniref:hypothetical protein n=1 Tax=Streptomyces lavendulae TaxID=1914 RepID=UPI0024A19D0E|nr:hypothetical protein [Streptomyces lavendulae]GLW02724.1 hypothetical protein Slala05_63540 [Streptomyces lavendulae subsp. lavendulae]